MARTVPAGATGTPQPSLDLVLRRTDDRDHPASLQLDLAEVIPGRTGHGLFPPNETDPDGVELLPQLVDLLDLQAKARKGVEQVFVRALRLEIFEKPRCVDNHRHRTTRLQREGWRSVNGAPTCLIPGRTAFTRSKLREKGFLVGIEQPDIVDPVTRHREPIDPHSKRESLVSIGIELTVTENFRADHARAEELHPSTAVKHVNLGAGRGEREKAGSKPQLDILSQQGADQPIEGPLEVGEADRLDRSRSRPVG